MSESQLQWRVGLFVIASGLVAAGLAFRFGELDFLWRKDYRLLVHFERAPGLEKGVPVRKNGLNIGRVSEVYFEEEQGGVTAVLEIREKYLLRRDSQPALSRGLLGDATIEFSNGTSKEFHKPGSRVTGIPATDPMEIVRRMEQQVSVTLDSFAATSEEWRKVAGNVNSVMDTHRGHLDLVIERAAESAHQFTLTMSSANKILGDPENVENLRATLAALPAMAEDTRKTIAAARAAVIRMDQNLANLNQVTTPLAKKSDAIVTKLENSISNLELLLAELSKFSRALNDEDGSLRLLASDPQLYRNLNASAASLNAILKNIDPAIKDLRVFTDKVARHPELIGVGGALKGSSGVK